MRKITMLQMAAVAAVVAGEMVLLGAYLIMEAINEAIR